MVRKYSCPICRAVYYETKKPEEPPADVEAQGDGPTEGTGNAEDSTRNQTGNNGNSTTTTTTSPTNNTNNISEPRREQV